VKNGKKPTLKQTLVLQRNKMDSSMWLIVKSLSDKLICVNKVDGKFKDAYLQVAKI
jgi:hypothetical protein